jgi:hypothetical protein
MEGRKDGRCTYNLTPRNIRIFIVALRKQKVLNILILCVCVCVCVCSIRCPACKAHAPYYTAICGLSGCTIFSHTISINGTNFRTMLPNKECVFLFSLQVFSRKTRHCNNNSKRHYQTRKYVFT